MDEQSWVLKMGEEDGVGVGRIYDSVSRLGTWVGGRGGSELGRRVGSVAACVNSVSQGSGLVRVEPRVGWRR